MTRTSLKKSTLTTGHLAEYEAAVSDGVVSVSVLYAILTAVWVVVAALIVLRDRNLGYRSGTDHSAMSQQRH